VKPEEAVHIGDDRRNDLWGARDAGCDAWLWGSDVYSFKEVHIFLFCSALVENSKHRNLTFS
jgi:FMN phosphatase YigB (HAD superfamily)